VAFTATVRSELATAMTSCPSSGRVSTCLAIVGLPAALLACGLKAPTATTARSHALKAPSVQSHDADGDQRRFAARAAELADGGVAGKGSALPDAGAPAAKASLALFDGATLIKCIDYSRGAPDIGTATRGTGLVRLNQSCESLGAPVQASCTYEGAVERYYRGTDGPGRMAECVRNAGRWTPVEQAAPSEADAGIATDGGAMPIAQ
jgi:hypothetical protein